MTIIEQFSEAYGSMIEGRRFVEYREYYTHARNRYERTFRQIAALGLPSGTRHLDIGGGQMALLTRKLLGFDACAGDVVDTAAADVGEQNLPFFRINLMDDAYDPPAVPYDLITMLEVIEHIPVPPYITLRKLRTLMAPGAHLVMTTPNGFRIRNILRMLANREVLGIYRYPEGDMPLGHQHEYTLRQMDWQLREAGFEIVTLRHYNPGSRGASLMARIMHILTAPASLLPHLRPGLMIVARKTGD